jgi:hypothetical protein
MLIVCSLSHRHRLLLPLPAFYQPDNSQYSACGTEQRQNEVVVFHTVDEHVVSAFDVISDGMSEPAPHECIQQRCGQHDPQILPEITYERIDAAADAEFIPGDRRT